MATKRKSDCAVKKKRVTNYKGILGLFGKKPHHDIPSNLNWHDKGGHYKIALGNALFHDKGGDHTRVPVFIQEKQTGKIITRIGEGKQIGNFHPVWVNWDGKKIQVEKILEIGW